MRNYLIVLFVLTLSSITCFAYRKRLPIVCTFGACTGSCVFDSSCHKVNSNCKCSWSNPTLQCVSC